MPKKLISFWKKHKSLRIWSEDMAIQVEFLKSVSYFSGLSLAELDLIVKLIFEKVVGRGEIVLFEGEPAEA